MPLAVYVLGMTIFAQGTSELMIAGLLPEMAADLGVSIPDAGLLISAFAIGMLVGAPVLAVVTLRWPRRTAMLTFLAIFIAAHVAGALTPGYAFLFGTRVVAAFVYAGFWAVASVSVVELVPSTVRGRALGILVGGLTVATLVGLPAGTLIGQYFGWRAAFWAVAAMSVLAMVAVVATIPAGRAASAAPARLGDELRAMREPRLWLAYGTTALTISGLLVSFSYLAPLLTGTTGVPEGMVPVLLALYGIGAVIGIAVGGRVADAHPISLLFVGLTGLLLTSAALAVFADVLVLTVPLVLLLGAFGFVVNPGLNTRVFALAERAPTLAAGVNISAFNIGITAGPWFGGMAIAAGWGFPSVGWIGAGLAAAALGTVALARAVRPARTAVAV
ncbi:Cmx/CmrA family chloramphenicol efflux MFS transporter [Actinomycetes bacterium KLBMP 9759]